MTPIETLRLEHELRAYIVEAKAQLDRILDEGGDGNVSTPCITFDLDGIEPVWKVNHYRWSGANTQAAQLTDAVTVWGERYRQQYKLNKLPTLLPARIIHDDSVY